MATKKSVGRTPMRSGARKPVKGKQGSKSAGKPTAGKKRPATGKKPASRAATKKAPPKAARKPVTAKRPQSARPAKKAAVKKVVAKKAAVKRAVLKKPVTRRAAAKKPAVRTARSKPAPKDVRRAAPSRPASRASARPKSAAPARKSDSRKASASRSTAPARAKFAQVVSSRGPVQSRSTAVKPAAVKAAKAKPAPKPARRSGRRQPERLPLPHKEPSRSGFAFSDYFDLNASPYPTLAPSRREVLPVAVEWKERMRPGELYQAFKRFFEANEIGNRLVPSLREAAATIIEFEGDPQMYKVVKIRGRAALELGRPASAELYVRFSRHAVEAILAPNATKPAEYVQRVAELLMETDPAKRIDIKLLCTHGEAIRKGYLGLVAAGGRALASTLLALNYSLPHEFVKRLA